MFHLVPTRITEQMHRLETIDARDRVDGTPHPERLRQIPPTRAGSLPYLRQARPGERL